MLQDFAININGSSYDHNNPGQPDLTTLPGMNAAGFNTSTGLGTLQYTFNPGVAGNYFVNFYFDYEVGAPFYNEYGAVNLLPPVAGESYEIEGISSAGVGSGGLSFWNGTTQSFNNPLSDTNLVPGTTTNYLNNCTAGAACNADVALALGFSFTLPSGDEAVLRVTGSALVPLEFNLEQVHPSDPNNSSPSSVNVFGSAVIIPAPVPEPSTWILVGTISALLFASRRKSSVRQKLAGCGVSRDKTSTSANACAPDDENGREPVCQGSLLLNGA